ARTKNAVNCIEVQRYVVDMLQYLLANDDVKRTAGDVGQVMKCQIRMHLTGGRGREIDPLSTSELGQYLRHPSGATAQIEHRWFLDADLRDFGENYRSPIHCPWIGLLLCCPALVVIARCALISRLAFG